MQSDALAETAEELRCKGQTVMLVAIDGQPAGLVGVADPIKASTPEAIRILHADGIAYRHADRRQSDDRRRRSRSKLGIDDIQADVLPEKKAEVG